jgi:uncharacterized membrane protein HdeD (DUF308 family)
MDLRRLRGGELIAGAAGLALLVSLFLAWYDGRTAWESFAVLDVILAVVGLAALSIPFVTAAYRVPALPLAQQSLTTLAGLLAVVLVLIRVVNLPDGADAREGGLWVGLVAALAIVAGCLIAMRDERRSPEGVHTDLSGVPAAGPPEIETLPAPRP